MRKLICAPNNGGKLGGKLQNRHGINLFHHLFYNVYHTLAPGNVDSQFCIEIFQ